MTHARSSRLLRALSAGTAAATLTVGLAACGSAASSSDAASVDNAATGAVTVAALANGAGTRTYIKVSEVASLHAELPASVAKGGQLVIGVGALPAGFPPLAFVGSDQQTLTGSEPDFGRLVAAVLGLKPVVQNSTWENLFVGIDSGRTDVGFSNITDTEERKKKYDFASYREDNLAFEVTRTSTWNFNGDWTTLAGKTVAVGAGTNQEKILLEWQAKLKAAGKQLTVKYFPDNNATHLALVGGKIDAYFGPNPGIAYQIAQDARTPNPTRNAGTYSGAGASLQGLIAATVKKGSGLARPIADAINYLIKNGQYAKWLAAWNLSNEAVPTSLVNPPGLPLTDS
ncbi:ABC transporter substrate-binding protein [Streptacidiphilus jiangxiensis]|uniref:Polar amino acid transport system substrate-binding protein n=1 Tax=Streptacidiphilus jiangxiensis TaxID=235985 RepID=A0A1H8AL78_STRJI|nr:ABC transporter substrate-binding protein [Streptacidiphilus jiangxiensis]SEM71515.1 polar amino acid transport system substrate-binding protein [Streptacidiphilus jiangxiensis]